MQINISQTLRVYNSRIHKIKNVKFSGYYFYMNLNAWGDFQICCTFKNSMTWKRGFKTFRNWAGDGESSFFFGGGGRGEAEGIFAGGLMPHYMPCMSWNSNKIAGCSPKYQTVEFQNPDCSYYHILCHWCFKPGFLMFSANIYLHKVNNRKTRTRCENKV